MNRRTSVGHRLILLIACQTLIALLLVLMGVRTISKLSTDYSHMYNFQFQSVAAIGLALEEAVTMPGGARSAALDAFYKKYRTEWETAGGGTIEAIEFRKDLADAGMNDLTRQESDLLEDLGRALELGKVDSIRDNLSALYSLNLRYAALENDYVMKRIRRGRIGLALTGLTGVALTALLGLYVRRAIAPRIRRLVAGVRDFQATGKHERIADPGRDDIAVLANALDSGFSAIASREKEREQFLAMAAHELKTPVTSIYGYASLLVSQPLMPARDLHRALGVINRQSWRLSRLIDSLLLTMQARAGKLHFEPKPFDMSALVGSVLEELEPLLPKRTFAPQIEKNISILGDEALLEHALRSLFICASAFSSEDVPLEAAFAAVDHRACLTVSINGDRVSIPEVQDLFMPFRFVQYETTGSGRSAVGLYLCREIVRIHNGSLRVETMPDRRPKFLMELPI